MRKLPAALFVIDSKKEEIAIKEAAKLKIPIVAVLDTNCDPDLVDYPLPGNDDAIRAVKLFCESAADSIKEGRDQFKQLIAEEEARAAAEEAAALAEKEAAAEAARKVAAGEPPLPVAASTEVVEDAPEEKLAARFANEEVVVDKVEKIKPKKAPRKEGGRTK